MHLVVGGGHRRILRAGRMSAAGRRKVRVVDDDAADVFRVGFGGFVRGLVVMSLSEGAAPPGAAPR